MQGKWLGEASDPLQGNRAGAGLRRFALFAWLHASPSLSISFACLVNNCSFPFSIQVGCISPLFYLLVLSLEAGSGVLPVLLRVAGLSPSLPRLGWLPHGACLGTCTLPHTTSTHPSLPLPVPSLYYLSIIMTFSIFSPHYSTLFCLLLHPRFMVCVPCRVLLYYCVLPLQLFLPLVLAFYFCPSFATTLTS